MSQLMKMVKLALLVTVLAGLSGCSDPQVYGSVGVSTGFGNHGGWGSPRVHTSISVGGRIR